MKSVNLSETLLEDEDVRDDRTYVTYIGPGGLERRDKIGQNKGTDKELCLIGFSICS